MGECGCCARSRSWTLPRRVTEGPVDEMKAGGSGWPGASIATALAPLIRRARCFWKHPLHPYYTDHSVDHSERIVVKLGQLAALLPQPNALNEREETVLAAAAYLHDIGMQYRKAAFSDADEARRKHHEVSREWIVNSVIPAQADQWPSLGLDLLKDIVDDIAVVAEGHRGVSLDGPGFDKVLRGDDQVRRRLLAALLRLADALDLDHRRVFIDRLRTEDVALESRLHWWKCYFVSGVEVLEDGVVQVHFRLPEGDLSAGHQTVVRAAVEGEIARALGETEDVLWGYGVRPRYRDPVLASSATIEPMTRSDLLALWERVEESWHKLPIPEPQYFAAWYRELEQFPSELVSKAEALAESAPFRAAKYCWKAAREYSGLGFALKAMEQGERAGRLCEQAKKLAAAFHCFLQTGRAAQEAGDADRARALFEHAGRAAKARSASRYERIAACARETALAMMGAGVAALWALRGADLDHLPPWLRSPARCALAWAHANDLQWQKGADLLLSAAEEETGPDVIVPLLLDAAYMMARAGCVQRAESQLVRCTALAEPLKDTLPSLWARLLSRQAHISYVCDHVDNASRALEDAVRFADDCADVRGRVVNRQNLLTVSFEAGAIPMSELADWTIGVDIQRRTFDDYERARAKEYDGLRAHRRGNLRSALHSYYASWRKHLETGNLIGTREAEERMGQLMADIGELGSAATYFASLGAVKELDALCKRLEASGDPALISRAVRSCTQLATNRQSRLGLCSVVARLFDYLPDADIAPLAERIMPWTEARPGISGARDLAAKAYDALAVLAFRAPDPIARRICHRCAGALAEDSSAPLVEAQMRCLSSAAQNRAWPDEKVMRFLEALEPHTKSQFARHQAFATMAQIVRPDTDPFLHLTKQLQAEARDGDILCGNILLQMPAPHVDPAALAPALSSYGEQLRAYASAGPGKRITVGGPLIWMIGHYVNYMSPEQLHEYADLLLQIATNAHQLLVHRQSAAEGLRLMASAIPETQLQRIWDGLHELAFGTLHIDGALKALLASQHPLSRMKVSAGTPDDVQMTCREALGALARRVDAGRRSRFCSELRDSFFRATHPTSLNASAAAVAAVFPHAARARRRPLFLRVYSMLAHPDPSAVQTALGALRLMLPHLPKADQREVVSRLADQLNAPHPDTRLNALVVAEQLLDMGAGDPARLTRLIEDRRDDPSWAVRREAHRLLANERQATAQASQTARPNAGTPGS